MSLDVGKLSNIAWKIPDTLKGQRDIGAVNIANHYTPSRLYYGCEDGRLIPVACQEDIEAMYGQRTEIDLNVTGGVAPYNYDWANIPGTNNPGDIFNLIAGQYVVTITDANGRVGC